MISLELFNLELGGHGSIFGPEYYQYYHITTYFWVKHLLKLIQDYSIVIDDVVQGGELMRNRDITLSSRFVEAAKVKIITKSEWKIANRCRVYLKYISVADIAVGNDKGVSTKIWKGDRQRGGSRDIDLPYQGNPGKRDWGV